MLVGFAFSVSVGTWVFTVFTIIDVSSVAWWPGLFVHVIVYVEVYDGDTVSPPASALLPYHAPEA